MKTSKVWYKSITIWFNIISVIAIVVEQQLELLRPLMSEHSYALLAISVASFNLYLRIYVHKTLTFRNKNA